MKRIALAFAALTTLAACSSSGSNSATEPAAIPTGTPVLTDSEFRDVVIDKTLVNDQATFQVLADGTLQGAINGSGSLTGTWLWEDEFFCRTANENYNCQRITVNGDSISFTRDKGAGATNTYRLQQN